MAKESECSDYASMSDDAFQQGDLDDSLDITQISNPRCCCTDVLHSIRTSKKTAVAVLFIAFLLDLMLLTAVEPVLPQILQSIDNDPNISIDNISSIEVGIMNGAKPLTQIVFNPFFGYLVDRYTHNVPMMVGFCFSLCSTLGFAYVKSYYVLLFFRCCQGIGSSLLTIAGLAMLSDVYKDPEARGKAMAVGFSGLAIGLVVGFPFGSILYDFVGRETPFLVLCGLIILGAAIRFCLMPIWIAPERKLEEPFSEEKGTMCCEELTVVLDPYILVATGAYFWLCYGVGSVMGLGPLYLISELKAEQWNIGVIFLYGAIMQCIVQYSFSVCAYKVGWWLLSFIGLMLVGVGVVTYPCASSLWWILGPQAVYSAGIGLVMGSIPALLGYLADIRANSKYGAVFALSDTGTNLGYFLGSTVTGVLVSKFKYIYVFAGSGAFVFCYGFVCFLLKNVPEKYSGSEDEKKGNQDQRYRRRSSHSVSLAP